MAGVRDIIWLLVVSVFSGPAGLGGSAGLAAFTKSCGVSCPCDGADREDHEGEAERQVEAEPCDDDLDADSGHDAGKPCEGECPDDCPNCGCGLGVAMAVLSRPVTSGATPCTSARMSAPVDPPSSGACDGVFRPPRLLT